MGTVLAGTMPKSPFPNSAGCREFCSTWASLFNDTHTYIYTHIYVTNFVLYAYFEVHGRWCVTSGTPITIFHALSRAHTLCELLALALKMLVPPGFEEEKRSQRSEAPGGRNSLCNSLTPCPLIIIVVVCLEGGNLQSHTTWIISQLAGVTNRSYAML